MPPISIEPATIEEFNLHMLAEDNDQYDGESIMSESSDSRTYSNRSILYLITITIGLSGLQGIFAVQFSHGSPYLLSLGFSKPLMALAWVAGPLAGALVQPYVGIRSDQSGHRWGKRRPYIAAGWIASILSLLGLAWVEEIVGIILQTSSAGPELISTATKVLAILFIYSLNAAVQPIQCGIRALIVEHCSKHQQVEANAWAGRLIEVGNIVIYLSAYAPLQRLLPFVSYAQFKILSITVSAGLAITLSITCLAIVEVPSREERNTTETSSILRRLWRVKNSIGEIPPEIYRICRIQFFSWMGWFPFLYYITTYISQIYVEQPPYSDKMPSEAKGKGNDILFDVAAVGSLALLLHATISLFTGFVVPILVRHTTARISSLIDRGNKDLGFHWFTLKRAWLISHILSACCLLSISVMHSLNGIILIVGVMGISRSVTTWAPYALLAADLSCGDEEEILTCSSNAGLGVILGIHNMAIALPQILSALACSVIFWFTRTEQVDDVNNSLEWIIRLSALPAFIAALLTLNLHGNAIVYNFAALRSIRAKERSLSLPLES